MKKLFQIVMILLFIYLINSCAIKFTGGKKLSSRISTVKLPKLSNIEYLIDHTSVLFKWTSIASLGLDGVAIYKKENKNSSKKLTLFAIINNPLSTYYVDNLLKANTSYTYIFTTLKDNYESYPSPPIVIETLGLLKPVTNIKVEQKYQNIIYLTWDIHKDHRIKYYEIERSINKSNWETIIKIKHRLMTEYIDSSILPNNNYYYRIKAFSFDGISSKDSEVVEIHTNITL